MNIMFGWQDDFLSGGRVYMIDCPEHGHYEVSVGMDEGVQPADLAECPGCHPETTVSWTHREPEEPDALASS